MIRRRQLLALIVLVGCATTPTVTAVLPGSAGDRDPAIANLLPCRFPPRSMGRWKTVFAPEREFAFKLPEEFIEVENPSGFVHGGSLWQRGDTTVSLRYGHWALDSFTGETEVCVEQIGGFETVVIRFQRPSPAYVFWFLGSGPVGGHELVMGLNGAAASDEDLLLSVGRSVFRPDR